MSFYSQSIDSQKGRPLIEPHFRGHWRRLHCCGGSLLCVEQNLRASSPAHLDNSTRFKVLIRAIILAYFPNACQIMIMQNFERKTKTITS